MQNESTRRTQRERREETRGRLLEAARALFAEKGYAATGTTEVASEAGVTRGALYHHFTDKEALFEAVVEREHRAIAATIDGAAALCTGDPLEALLAGGDAFLEAMQDEGRRRLLLLDAPSVLGRERLAAIDERHGLRTLVEGVEHAMDVGALRALPRLPLAHLLNALFDRAALESGDRLAEHREVIHAVLDGLRR